MGANSPSRPFEALRASVAFLPHVRVHPVGVWLKVAADGVLRLEGSSAAPVVWSSPWAGFNGGAPPRSGRDFPPEISQFSEQTGAPPCTLTSISVFCTTPISRSPATWVKQIHHPPSQMGFQPSIHMAGSWHCLLCCTNIR